MAADGWPAGNMMSAMEAKVFEAFRSAGVPDDKAIAAAEALSERDPGLAAMRDDIGILKSDMTTVKAELGVLKTDVAALKTDVSALKIDVALLKWMAGFGLAMGAAIVLKLFLH